MGLFLVGTILIIFGLYVLFFNITLIYKGMNAVKKVEVSQANSVSTKSVEMTRMKRTTKEAKPEVGEEIGRLHIPKLKISIPIYHGTNDDELIKGVGHVIGTAFPGENNNAVLSGHRDTVFQKLDEVTIGDILKVENNSEMLTYKVRKVRIVEADDLTVIVPKPKATLTVSTCYPFTFVGPAKQRYVLVADLIEAKVNRI
ncbi:MAG: class D sortase [Anaerobacillus sp.]|uniref:class D sortase n=1 Tax=Anaerobacillus sp. TaxID=1872506 RepID=UPI0039191FA6